MRALALLAMAAASRFGVNIAEQVRRGIDDPQGPPVGSPGRHGKRKFMTEEHYRLHDKFFGIRSTGRRGASSRMQMQLAGFKETRVGKRPADRSLSGIPFHLTNRNNVFLASIGAGMTRNEAMKQARRVAA